ANKDQRFVARDIWQQSKCRIVVRIADDKRMAADLVGHGCANRDIGHARQKRALETIVPGHLAASIEQPGLMDNECLFSQQQCRNQTSQTDVVLKEQIAPTNKSDQFDERWTPRELVIRS